VCRRAVVDKCDLASGGKVFGESDTVCFACEPTRAFARFDADGDFLELLLKCLEDG
jgi:hypothetical protein